MKEFTNQAFTLHSDALEANTLIVNKLKGHEQLSGLFRFELELLSADKHLVLEEVVASAVTLTIKQLSKVDLGMVAENREFTGVLTEFEQHEEGQGWVSYRATLVPEVWQLTQFHRSRIFQKKSAPQIVKELLEERGLLASVDGANGGSGDFGDFDFEPKIDKKMESPTEDQAEYPLRSYVVQYEENDWDFLTRWLEHEGIYFYFENEEKRERIVFGDASTDCVAVSSDSLEASFPYRPATGSGSSEGVEERIITFLCKQTRAPQQVALNDYNWRDAVRLSTVQQVDENGVGLQTEYNDHYKNEDQGKALAKARMEELLCLTKLFHGTSTARAFRPGKTFKLKEHYRSDFNIDYLLVSVVHEAEQTINLAASTVTGATYHNSFTAIPADVPFRPDRVTDWPTIKGVMNAKVDAIEGTKYADLDKNGCYTVRIPFDPKYEEDNPGGASRRVRMAQPFTGMDAGFHFPLLGGTEVILTHVDGDPDRPIIAGAVPDAATGNVGAGDESRNRIVSNAGNRFEIHDTAGASGFFMADATGAVVSDQRNRLGNKKGGTAQGAKAASKSPGSGGGGAPSAENRQGPAEGERAQPKTREEAAELLGRPVPEPSGEDLPGSGLGMGMGKVTGDAAGSDVDGDGRIDPGEGGPAAQLAAFLGGTAAGVIAAGKYVGGVTGGVSSGDIMDCIDLVTSKHTEVGTPGDTHYQGANKFAGFEASETSGHLGDGLGMDLPGAPTAPAASGSAIGLLAGVNNFEGLAFGSRLRVWLGDTIQVNKGDKYTYADVSHDVSYGTGGYGFHEENGHTNDESFHYGNASSDSHTYGDSFSKSEVIGDSLSVSTVSGDDNSTSSFYGNKVSLDFKGSAETSTSITLGAYNSNSMLLGLKSSADVFIGGEASGELYVAAFAKMTVSAGPGVEVKVAPTWLQAGPFPLEEKINVKKLKLALSETQAILEETTAAVKENSASISSTNAALKNTVAALKADELNLVEYHAALDAVTAGVKASELVVNGTYASMTDIHTRAVSTELSGTKIIS